MKTLTFALGILLLGWTGCSTTFRSKDDVARKEQDGIQGTWKLVALEYDGKQAPPEIVAALKLVFRGDTLTFTPGEPGFTNYKYKLDPAAKPPRFALTHADGPDEGQTEQGISLLDGDHLKICFGKADKRPVELTATAGSGQGMYSLERER